LRTAFVPSFSLTQVELPLALVRGFFVAALFSAFGALVFRSLIRAPSENMRGGKALLFDRPSLAYWSVLAAALSMLGWLVLEAVAITDAGSAGEAVTAIPSVIRDTSFGNILAAQALALLGIAAALMIERPASHFGAMGLAGMAVVLQAGHSHAYAMAHGLSLLLLSQVMHLLAAGAWLGGLVPLLLFVREAPPNTSATAAQRFSALGVSCVLVLAATATFQGWALAGGLWGLVGTAYGWVLLTKPSSR
jgi:copper resistance protein D